MNATEVFEEWQFQNTTSRKLNIRKHQTSPDDDLRLVQDEAQTPVKSSPVAGLAVLFNIVNESKLGKSLL